MNYKECRLAANMTQQELADRVGVTKSCICQIENFSREPSVKLLTHISVVLNVCINVLLGIRCNVRYSNIVNMLEES